MGVAGGAAPGPERVMAGATPFVSWRDAVVEEADYYLLGAEFFDYASPRGEVQRGARLTLVAASTGEKLVTMTTATVLVRELESLYPGGMVVGASEAKLIAFVRGKTASGRTAWLPK